MLPGPLFEIRQPTAALPPTAREREEEGAERELPVTLVVFVGGVTSAEVSALRWLGRRPGATRRFVVLTTHMCTGTTLMSGLIDRVENNLAFGPTGMAGQR